MFLIPLSSRKPSRPYDAAIPFLQVVRPSRIFWIVTLVAMVLILLFLPRSPLPWLDETFFASTSLAVARGGPPIPTVLGAFPILAASIFFMVRWFFF